MEPVIGNWKELGGMPVFHRRGLPNVAVEWALAAIAFNLKRRHRVRTGYSDAGLGAKTQSRAKMRDSEGRQPRSQHPKPKVFAAAPQSVEPVPFNRLDLIRASLAFPHIPKSRIRGPPKFPTDFLHPDRCERSR